MKSSGFARGIAVLIAIAAVAGFAALAVVVPHRDTATITVARFGDKVELLPPGFALSFRPLARRMRVPRADGAAIVEATAQIALPGGATATVPIKLRLRGSGRLPVSAAVVRASGWDSAWRQALSQHLSLPPAAAQALLAGSTTWHEIFPDDPIPPLPDLTPTLAPFFRPLDLAGVDLGRDLDPDVVRAAARSELRRRSPEHGRLVLLGLDAADWHILDPLMQQGRMPHLAALLRRGTQAILDVPQPLISPVVWTTIATGVPPEVHGVLDFLEPDPETGTPRPVTSSSRKAPALWQMFSAAGRRSAVIGWWATFPAQAPPGGAVYSDRLTEQLLGLSSEIPHLADPPEAAEAAHELAIRARDVTPAMLAPYVTVSAQELQSVLARQDAWDDPIGGLAKLVAATVTVERLTRRELDRGTDVVLSYLEGTDTVGHLYAPYLPPPLPGFDPAIGQRFGGVVDRYYEHVDDWIGRVAASLGPNDTLILVSDHGFRWGSDRPRVPAGAHTATATMWHRPEGMFVAAGPRVHASLERHRLGILDVAPSILALAGLPAGSEMRGRVPAWLMLESGANPQPVDYSVLLPRVAEVKVDLPPEAREEELAKLRALGYLAGGEKAGPSPAHSPVPAAGAGGGETTPAEPSLSLAVPTPAFDRAEARRLNNLAISQASSDEPDNAEETFRKALKADPTYASAYYSFSVLLRKQERFDEADKMFWAAVRLGVRERELAVVRLALDYRRRGMLDKAREALSEGRRLFPDSGTIWLNSGVFLGEQGDYAGARDCLVHATEIEPKNAAAFRNLGVALIELGDREGARKALSRAVELDPTDDPTRQQLEALGGPVK